MNRLDFFDPDQQPSHDCVHETSEKLAIQHILLGVSEENVELNLVGQKH